MHDAFNYCTEVHIFGHTAARAMQVCTRFANKPAHAVTVEPLLYAVADPKISWQEGFTGLQYIITIYRERISAAKIP